MGERLFDEKFLDCSISTEINCPSLLAQLFRSAKQIKGSHLMLLRCIMVPLLQSLKELRLHQNKGLVDPSLFLKAQGITVVKFRNRDGAFFFSFVCYTEIRGNAFLEFSWTECV
jgi:hypothetical protein